MSKISSGSLTVVDIKGGSDGINTATIYLYQRAATAPSKPSTNLTYTFANAKLTGELGSWTQDIGTLTGSDPIWVIAAVASSNGKTDIIEPKDWSEPIKMAQDGQDGQPGAPGQPGAKGLNQATVFIYKRAQSVTKPSDSEYTFETGSFTVTDGWQKTVPAATTENRNPCWVCTAVAIGSESSAALKWNTPSVLVENGSDGVSPVVTSTDNGVQIYDPVNDVTYTITNGVDGTSYFTHILYSSKATPTSADDVSTSPTGKDYVGIQTTTSRTAPSWNDSGWQWMKYIGNDGTSVTVSSVKYAKSTTDSQPQDSSFNTALPTVGEGEWLWTMTTYSDGSKVYTKSKQGKSGTSVTVSKTEYQAGTSATTAPTGEWKTTIPSVAEGQYLWTKTTYSDGNYSYTVAKQGKSGTSITISSTSVKYQVGTSATTAPTGEWKDTVQSTTTGQYLWTRTIVTYSDGSETTSYSVSAHGATGTSVSISSIKYATSTTDSQPADSSFGTSIPTVSEGQWLWTMTTYSNGSKMYTKSKQGKSGVSVTKTRELYYLKTNSTNVPTITATSQITATDRVNGWTSVVPTYVANGTYYTCIETSLSTGGPVWSTPVANQGLTDANANAAESLSVSTHANENAQGALSISRATQQHFWFNPTKSGSIEAGAYITDTPIDTFKNGKSGGYLLARSDGIMLGRGENRYMELSGSELNSELKFYKAGTTDTTASTASNVAAKLSSTGLEIAKGSITLGDYFSVTSEGVLTAKSGTIGGWTIGDTFLSTSASGTPGANVITLSKGIAGPTTATGVLPASKTWAFTASNKFGVTTAGNLYATDADISGTINATHGSIAGDVSIGGNVTIGSSVTIGGKAQSEYLNSNIEIGGRNFVRNSQSMDDWIEGSSASITIEEYSYATLVGTASNWNANINSRPTQSLAFFDGRENVISFEYKATADWKTNDSAFVIAGSNSEVGAIPTSGRTKYTTLCNVVTLPACSEWTKVSIPCRALSISDLTSGSGDVNSWYLQCYLHKNDITVDIRKIKLEKGNKATDWTPAPEDVAATATSYITKINDTGITIHPEVWNNESSYIQLDGTGMELFNSSGVSIAQYGDVAKIGINNSSRFLMNADSLQAYNSSNQKYFEVNENGLTWGNNVAATVAQVEAAGQASKYITEVGSNGITIHTNPNSNPQELIPNYLHINSNGIAINQQSGLEPNINSDIAIAQFTKNKIQLGPDDLGHITISRINNLNRIGFWENSESEVAYITDSEMNIARTVVLQSMKVGNWQWTAMSSGNLRLQWIGGINNG